MTLLENCSKELPACLAVETWTRDAADEGGAVLELSGYGTGEGDHIEALPLGD